MKSVVDRLHFGRLRRTSTRDISTIFLTRCRTVDGILLVIMSFVPSEILTVPKQWNTEEKSKNY